MTNNDRESQISILGRLAVPGDKKLHNRRGINGPAILLAETTHARTVGVLNYLELIFKHYLDEGTRTTSKGGQGFLD